MTVGLLGINTKSLAFAIHIKKHIQNSGLKLSGVYSSSTKATVDAAIALGASAYSNMQTLIRNSDILLIGCPHKELADISNKLKEERIRNKILCHFSSKYDSSIIYCGVTNTVYSVTLPYMFDNAETADFDKAIVLFEGNGRREKEFEEEMHKIFNKCKFCSKTDRRIALIAKRTATIHLRNVIRFARHAFKVAGVFDEECMKSLISACAVDSCLQTVNSTDTGKTDETELRKDMLLLESINDGDSKEFYRNMELHSLETIPYSNEEKMKLQKLLGKKPKNK